MVFKGVNFVSGFVRNTKNKSIAKLQDTSNANIDQQRTEKMLLLKKKSKSMREINLVAYVGKVNK